MIAPATNSTERLDQEPLLIAISPDLAEREDGGSESFAQAWAKAARSAGHRVRLVNLIKADVLENLVDCDGLMCRFAYTDRARGIAPHILSAVELGLGIPVYPSLKTAWAFRGQALAVLPAERRRHSHAQDADPASEKSG